MSLGQKLLSSLVRAEKAAGLESFARLQLGPEYFVGNYEAKLFETVQDHVRRYGVLPALSTLKAEGFDDLPKAPEPPEFYAEKCRERFIFRELREALKLVEADMNEDRPAEAMERMLSVMTRCQVFAHRNEMLDFKTGGHDLIKREYNARLKQDYHEINTGWSYLDDMTGGLRPGDIYVIVGRPGAGKTYLVLNIAHTAWVNGYTPMLVSMEMNQLAIAQRLAAIHTKKPITGIRRSQLSKFNYKGFYDVLKALPTNDQLPPFWIINGALSTKVEDVVVLARQLKPHVILIDGAYMMKLTGSGSRAQRWERLTEVVQMLKSDVAMALNIPVVVSYQFNREKGTKGLEHIAGADAVGQIASVVLGMLQDKSIETLRQRTVEVLKGREGESGQFQINWVFDHGPDYMNFTEIKESKDDLQFV